MLCIGRKIVYLQCTITVYKFLLQVFSRPIELPAVVGSMFKTTAARNSEAGVNCFSLSLAALPGVHKLFFRPLHLLAAVARQYKAPAAKRRRAGVNNVSFLTFTLLSWAGVNKLSFSSFYVPAFLGRGE